MSFLSSVFKGTKPPAPAEAKTALDLVTYTAGLVSDPASIDPLLDKVRKITATQSTELGLSPEDEATLIEVYLGLEAYLTSQDPIRTYTKEELRSRLNDDLLAKLNAHQSKGEI